MPLAMVAESLGLTLNEITSIAEDNLLQLSFRSYYLVGSRITRGELVRSQEIGAEELLRLATQETDEIIEDAIKCLYNDNIELAEQIYKRADDRKGYSPLSWVFETALELVKGQYDAVISSIRFICSYDDMDGTVSLANLGRVLKGLKLKEHGAEVLREQILALTEGKKLRPFDKSYDDYGKQIGMRLDENQKHAMFLATAVTRALKNYKYIQQFKSYRGSSSELREVEFEGIIKDALYTALQAESTYYDLAASKMYVDKLVALLPVWWVPAEEISLLSTKKKSE